MCDKWTWHHKTFLMQLYWHLAIKLYCTKSCFLKPVKTMFSFGLFCVKMSKHLLWGLICFKGDLICHACLLWSVVFLYFGPSCFCTLVCCVSLLWSVMFLYFGLLCFFPLVCHVSVLWSVVFLYFGLSCLFTTVQTHLGQPVPCHQSLFHSEPLLRQGCRRATGDGEPGQKTWCLTSLDSETQVAYIMCSLRCGHTCSEPQLHQGCCHAEGDSESGQ